MGNGVTGKRAPLRDRLMSKVVVGEPEDCWPFIGFCDNFGYGRVSTSARSGEGAHRVAYKVLVGPIPAGMCVLHRCDNPPCCNPAHLFIGTKDDNIKDMIAKGRAVPTGAPGERNYFSKLTSQQVVALREELLVPADDRRLADRLHMSPTAMRRIRLRETWAHLPG